MSIHPHDDPRITEQLTADFLEDTLTRVADKALKGELTDSERVGLYRLCLTVCAEEFYRVENENGGGLVQSDVLLLLQQISLLCEDEVTPEKLMGAAHLDVEHTVKETERGNDENSGRGEQASG